MQPTPQKCISGTFYHHNIGDDYFQYRSGEDVNQLWPILAKCFFCFFNYYFRIFDGTTVQSLFCPNSKTILLMFNKIRFVCEILSPLRLLGQYSDWTCARRGEIIIICFHSLSLYLFLFFYRVSYFVLVVCYFLSVCIVYIFCRQYCEMPTK